MSLRLKILSAVVGLILLLGLGGTFHARYSLASISRDQLVKRGEAIASGMASDSENMVLTEDIFGLYELVNSTMVNNDDVRYVIVLDDKREPLVQSFPEGLPTGLLAANQPSPDGQRSVRRIPTDEGAIQDVAVPVLEGEAGVVRVGLSENGLQERVNTLTFQLLALTGGILILGLILAYGLATLLTRPLGRLSAAAQAVGRGDLSQRVAPERRDEVGWLATAFNAMTEDLARSRDVIDESQRQILRQNQELAALNDVAAAVGRSLESETVMEGALDKVLSVMEADAGGILLWDKRAGGLAYKAHRGLSQAYVEGVAGLQVEEGIAGRVAGSGEPIALADIATDPRAEREAVHDIHAFASIPLRSKEQMVGVLNVARRNLSPFSEREVGLLTAFGHQIGVAIENARLWSEVKDKERALSELLKKTISAQEEERQRIARELHDEMAQGLTALLMGLGRLESSMTSVPPPVTETIETVKEFASAALDDTRRLVLDLRPTVLDDLGLVSALRQYAETRLDPLGVSYKLEARRLQERLPPPLELALFRILQEAINNCGRHADAQHVRIQLEQENGEIRAQVEDDGKGFDLWSLMEGKGEKAPVGIIGMRERAALLGGQLGIDTRPGRGTRISVSVPMNLFR
ncbi:MAG: GAF domain-containing protein [Anaerolineae bacterium]|nr:GAF domain-containing protein [Anaerolineae bacterium]NIN98794.1 GAF domain-containing protein [Anaerolineae bacterium]